MNLTAISVVGSLLLATSINAQTASLKMRFVFDGALPARETIDTPSEFNLAEDSTLDEALLADRESKGIRNVVVCVDTGRGGSKLDLAPHKSQQRCLVISNVRFEPHILLARVGDSLQLKNVASDRHCPNIEFFNMPIVNVDLQPGETITVPLAGPASAPITSSACPWMKSFLVVLDHPFASVSDSTGAVSIDGLPSGASLTFMAYHESLRLDHVIVTNKPTQWKRSRFEVFLQPGHNDLGTVFVPSAAVIRRIRHVGSPGATP
ncbi:hypothetical protein Poly51_45870 [Rubripirellula tenax]|uniref:Uncharacterized protein n=1 Tax=Rubripirellula tenax TaxID=2528015 RepID=A0A5C6EM97_9BACT|nr:hypothetical protein Poly51_45870 [Rubripirellula tenax]